MSGNDRVVPTTGPCSLRRFEQQALKALIMKTAAACCDRTLAAQQVRRNLTVHLEGTAQYLNL